MIEAIHAEQWKSIDATHLLTALNKGAQVFELPAVQQQPGYRYGLRTRWGLLYRVSDTVLEALPKSWHAKHHLVIQKNPALPALRSA